jgi:hypothetical protein
MSRPLFAHRTDIYPWTQSIQAVYQLVISYRLIYIGSLSKLKPSRYRPKVAYSVGGGIALLFLNLGARRGWVVSTTHRPLYPQEILGTHCTGGWVGPRTGLDVCEKSRPHRDSIPGPSSP